MAVYEYECGSARHEREFPLGAAPRHVRCEHGCSAHRVLSVPYLSVTATPSSRPHAASAVARERSWSADLDAFARMRKRGLQPEGVDGAARVENEVGDQFDITYRPLVQRYGRNRVEDAVNGTVGQ